MEKMSWRFVSARRVFNPFYPVNPVKFIAGRGVAATKDGARIVGMGSTSNENIGRKTRF